MEGLLLCLLFFFLLFHEIARSVLEMSHPQFTVTAYTNKALLSLSYGLFSTLPPPFNPLSIFFFFFFSALGYFCCYYCFDNYYCTSQDEHFRFLMLFKKQGGDRRAWRAKESKFLSGRKMAIS